MPAEATATAAWRDAHGHLVGAPLLAATLADWRGRVAVVSSFGAEAAVLLHMAAELDRAVPVIFLDTGKLFWQTRFYRSKLVDRLGLTDVRIVRPLAGELARRDPDGSLVRRNPDACCEVRKVRPLDRALDGLDAVVSGRKRYHGSGRKDLDPVSLEGAGRLKIEPLAEFDADDIEDYFVRHDLPRHPLREQGYYSIGCADCTTKGGTAADPRAGRWSGTDKTECGIHWTPDGRPLRPA